MRTILSSLRTRMWLWAAFSFIIFGCITYTREHFGKDSNGADFSWNEPARDIALGFFPLGLSIIAWEYFLRSARDREIIERVREGVTDTISVKLKKLTEFERSGIVQVRHGVSNTELRDFMASSRNKLSIMVPFFVEPLALKPIFIERLARKNFDLKILLLHPDSVFLTQRSRVVFKDEHTGKSEVLKTISVVLAAHARSPAGTPEIRFYSSLPSIFVVQADDRALMGFHLNEGTALDHPHFEIALRSETNDSTVLGEMIEAELGRVMSDDFSRKLDWPELEQILKTHHPTS